MSSEKNKSIIKKAQELLQEYGHSVKTGHLYELFSKLANESSWNSASKKEVSFLDKVVNQSIIENSASPMIQAKRMYEEFLKANPKDTSVTLGMVLEQENQPAKLLNKKMEMEPNVLFVGAMGTGKSVGMSGTLFNYLQKNPENTLIFIMDPLKGAVEYKALFDLPKVFPVLNSEIGIHRIITLIYDEALSRINELSKERAENVSQYEEKTGKRLDRIILAMEEFHSIPFRILNFNEDFKTPGTSAYKFHQLMRIGRSLGIWVFAAAQRAVKSDIPPEILPNFTQKQVFRVSMSEAAYLLSDTKASKIRSDQKGLCETEFGTVQFPLFSIEEQLKVIKEIKQENFNNLIITGQLIKDSLSSDPDDYSLRKLSNYIEDIKHYDLQLVLKKLHEKMGHTVELINHKIDPHGLGLIVNWPNKGKIAVMFNEKPNAKNILKLSKGMDVNNCERGIFYCLKKDLPSAIYKTAIDHKVEIVDSEDLLRLAYQLEEKEK